MNDILEKLRADHVRTAALLRLIEEEIETFRKGQRPNYEFVQDVIDYALTYPDLVHHPVEDLVLKRLLKKNPDLELTVGDLTMEHRRLAALTRRFHAALVNILSDSTLPRDWFVGVAREYVDFSRRHMQMEEVVFLPAAEAALDAADWKAVARGMPKTIDPLAIDNPAPSFARIKERICLAAA